MVGAVLNHLAKDGRVYLEKERARRNKSGMDILASQGIFFHSSLPFLSNVVHAAKQITAGETVQKKPCRIQERTAAKRRFGKGSVEAAIRQ